MNISEAYELGMAEGMRRFTVGGPVFTPDAIAADDKLAASFDRGVDKGEADARYLSINDPESMPTFEQPSYVLIDFTNINTGAHGRIGWCYVGGKRRNWTFEHTVPADVERGYQGDDLGNESDFGPCFGTYRRWGAEPHLDLSARRVEDDDIGF